MSDGVLNDGVNALSSPVVEVDPETPETPEDSLVTETKVETQPEVEDETEPEIAPADDDELVANALPADSMPEDKKPTRAKRKTKNEEN